MSNNVLMKYFSKEELLSIFSSILLLTLVISYPNFKETVFITFFAVFLYFLVKQPAHKWMASKHHCTSTFKLWPIGIFATVFTILLKITELNFPILLSGYIEVLPYRFGRKGIKVISMTPRDSAMVSLAGVAAGMILAIIFTILPYEFAGIVADTLALLLIYDLLPFPNSDGGRIFTWHIIGWIVLLIVTGIIFIV